MKTVDKFHTVPVLYPVANALAGTVNTAAVQCMGEGVLFELTKGVSTGGTATHTITIRASSDAAFTATSAVDFMYRVSTTPDTWGAWTQALAAAGFATTAGSNDVYQMYVDGQILGATGYEYAYLRSVEIVADACVCSIIAHVVNPSYVVNPQSLID